MKSTVVALAVTLLAAASTAAAQTTVTDAWVRGTVAQQKATGLYGVITSAGGGRLVAASSPVAGRIEIHQMSMDGDMMKMREVPGGVALPAGKPVKLESGGYHLMLMELKKPLAPAEAVPVTLVIERADKTRETVQISAPVKALGAAEMPKKH